MLFTEGTRLGPYEITAPIGAGGMGEVYKAHDTRLDRHGRDQGAAVDARRRRARTSALRARGARHRGPQPPPHLSPVRHRAPGRRRLPGHGVPRRRVAGRPPCAGPPAARAGPPIRHRDLRSADGGPRRGHRAPRPQARQRHHHEDRSEAARLRPGETAPRGAVGPVGCGDAAADHRCGCDDRHAAVHVAGAGRGTRGRHAQRHLCAGRDDLRDGDEPPALRGALASRSRCRDPLRRPSGAGLQRPRALTGVRLLRPVLPVQEPG